MRESTLTKIFVGYATVVFGIFLVFSSFFSDDVSGGYAGGMFFGGLFVCILGYFFAETSRQVRSYEIVVRNLITEMTENPQDVGFSHLLELDIYKIGVRQHWSPAYQGEDQYPSPAFLKAYEAFLARTYDHLSRDIEMTIRDKKKDETPFARLSVIESIQRFCRDRMNVRVLVFNKKIPH